MSKRLEDRLKKLPEEERPFWERVISRHNAELNRARKNAQRDKLTGFYRKELFDIFLKQNYLRAEREELPLSLAIFDIDYFKKVNDTWGHPVGDAVLRKLSAEVKKAMRPYEILGRVGGEEFGVVYPVPDNKVNGIVERLRSKVEHNCRFFYDLSRKTLIPGLCVDDARAAGNDVREFSVTISIGHSNMSQGASDWQELYFQADDALYRAKASGRNRVIYFGDKSPLD